MGLSSFVWFFFEKRSYDASCKTVKCELCDKLVNYTLNCSTGSIRHHLVQQHNLCNNNYKKHKMYQRKTASTQNESEDENNSNSTNEDSQTAANSNKKQENYIIDSLLDFLLCTDQSFSLIQFKKKKGYNFEILFKLK